MLEPNSPPDLVQFVKTALRSVSGEVMASRLNLLLRNNALDIAQQTRIPALILSSMKDRLVSPQASGNLIAAIPSARVLRLEGPHLLLQTRPREAMNFIETAIENLIETD